MEDAFRQKECRILPSLFKVLGGIYLQNDSIDFWDSGSENYIK